MRPPGLGNKFLRRGTLNLLATAHSNAIPRSGVGPGARPERIFYPALDGLRGFAFLLVFCFHVVDWATPVSPAYRASPIVYSLINGGRYGVSLFFVLSSFLVTKLLTEEARWTGRIDIKSFLIRRSLRLWPLYFLVVLIYILWSVPRPFWPGTWWTPQDQNAQNALYYLVFLADIRHMWPPDSMLSHLWSIGTEEKFYLLWPLVLVRLPAHRVLHVCYALIAFAWIYRLIVADRMSAGFPWAGPFAYVDAFAYGALIALRAPYPVRRVQLGGGAVLTLFLTILAAIGAFEFVYYGGPDTSGALHAVGVGLIHLFCGAFLLLVRDDERGWATWKPLGSLGRRSYGAYLFHFPIGLLVTSHYPQYGTVGRLLMVGGIFLATLGLAWASYRFIESPFLRLKRRFERVESRPGAGGGSAAST